MDPALRMSLAPHEHESTCQKPKPNNAAWVV